VDQNVGAREEFREQNDGKGMEVALNDEE